MVAATIKFEWSMIGAGIFGIAIYTSLKVLDNSLEMLDNNF